MRQLPNFNAENEDLVCQRTLEDFFDVISPREEIMIDKFNLIFCEIWIMGLFPRTKHCGVATRGTLCNRLLRILTLLM